jgi:NAD(P)-dependent dehydrogenase (short-subunit alcohol dehydrogenase family)
MAKKICLVTGANSGLGKEIALSLASAGMHVIMVCRNPIKGKAALDEIKSKTGSKSVDLLIADLSSQTDIRLLAKTIHEQYSMINILINNAAIVLLKKTFSADNIEMNLATNYLGPFLLTQLLLDLLKENAPSRIINISSGIHKFAHVDLADLQFEHRNYQSLKAYAQSKLLMNIASFELARRLERTDVTVNCVDPGSVNTHLGTDNATNLVLKWVDRSIKYFLSPPKEAAKTPVYLTISPEFDNVTGKYFVKGKPVLASRASYDLELAKKVWEVSERLVGINLKKCRVD